MDHHAAHLWVDMLNAFRALGGTAENICLGDGPFGRGLFPCDPSKPFRLRVPDPLLVEVKYIRFPDNVFRLSPAAPVGARERGFLENYQRLFSWGTSRGPTEDLLRMTHDTPETLREFLRSVFDFELWLADPTPENVQERYFSSRYITYKGRGVVMPIVELANHGRGCLYEREDGVGLSGRLSGEILARYGFTDALDILNNWGFASGDQPFALSLRLEVQGRSGVLVIGRGDVSTDAGREPFVPDVAMDGNRMTLSCLMVGHREHPSLARDIFRRVLHNAGWDDADALFDKILDYNRTQFEQLAIAAADAPPALAEMLRSVARSHLDAIGK